MYIAIKEIITNNIDIGINDHINILINNSLSIIFPPLCIHTISFYLF